jgi:hypothetical protein
MTEEFSPDVINGNLDASLGVRSQRCVRSCYHHPVGNVNGVPFLDLHHPHGVFVLELCWFLGWFCLLLLGQRRGCGQGNDCSENNENHENSFHGNLLSIPRQKIVDSEQLPSTQSRFITPSPLVFYK